MVSHSFRQLRLLSTAIADRKALEQGNLADAVRMAHNADRADYDRWKRGLRPTVAPLESRRSITKPSDGFAYVRK